MIDCFVGSGRFWWRKVPVGEPHFHHVQVSVLAEWLPLRHGWEYNFLRLRLRLPVAHMDSGIRCLLVIVAGNNVYDLLDSGCRFHSVNTLNWNCSSFLLPFRPVLSLYWWWQPFFGKSSRNTTCIAGKFISPTRFESVSCSICWKVDVNQRRWWPNLPRISAKSFYLSWM